VATLRVGHGPPLLLLPATLSSARDLRALAQQLGATYRVIGVDRRGAGATPLPSGTRPGPIDVAVHVADLVALIDREGAAPVTVVGHSYGGCLALELAARYPGLVVRAWVYEPPYAPVGRAGTQARLGAVGRETQAAYDEGGLEAAAEAFLSGVAGPASVAALPPTARERIRAQGAGALADAALLGLEPAGLGRIVAPVTVATGTASAPVYVDVAEGLLARIAGATHERIADADHMAPVTRPGTIAAAILGTRP
jgi:pimeloyl-ACP methyl ester carboxylesterase